MEKPRSVEEFLRNIEPYKKGVYEIGLFGSYARGDHGADSDIDLLIVLREKKLREKMMDSVDSAMEAVGYKELLSPVIMDMEHFGRIKELNSDFYYFLKKEGKTLWRSKR